MSYEVIWPEEVLRRVREIFDYVADLASEASALKLVNELLDATEPLQNNPRLYPVFPSSIVHARHIVVRPEWRILYVVDDETQSCTVVDVVSTRQHV